MTLDAVEVCNAARMEVGLPPTGFWEGTSIRWPTESDRQTTWLAHRAAMLGHASVIGWHSTPGVPRRAACRPCWEADNHSACRIPILDVLAGHTCERHQ